MLLLSVSFIFVLMMQSVLVLQNHLLTSVCQEHSLNRNSLLQEKKTRNRLKKSYCKVNDNCMIIQWWPSILIMSSRIHRKGFYSLLCQTSASSQHDKDPPTQTMKKMKRNEKHSVFMSGLYLLKWNTVYFLKNTKCWKKKSQSY